LRSYEGREACCAWRHYSNQNVVALADNIALKQPCSEANQRHKAGNFLTLRKESDVKKQAMKLLELKMIIVRDLITEWKEKEVITTVRVTKGKTKLQGVGLAEKSGKRTLVFGSADR